MDEFEVDTDLGDDFEVGEVVSVVVGVDLASKFDACRIFSGWEKVKADGKGVQWAKELKWGAVCDTEFGE